MKWRVTCFLNQNQSNSSFEEFIKVGKEKLSQSAYDILRLSGKQIVRERFSGRFSS